MRSETTSRKRQEPRSISSTAALTTFAVVTCDFLLSHQMISSYASAKGEFLMPMDNMIQYHPLKIISMPTNRPMTNAAGDGPAAKNHQAQ